MVLRSPLVLSFFIITVLLMTISWTHACRCNPRQFRQEKCRRATFVFRGYAFLSGFRVINQSLHRRYCFLIDRIFKDTDASLNPPCVYVPTESNLCSYEFQTWRRYIVSGAFTRSGNIVNTCYWIERWDMIPPPIRSQVWFNPNYCVA